MHFFVFCVTSWHYKILLWQQRIFAEEFRSFSEIDGSPFSKNRPSSLYSAPKVSHFPESFFDSGMKIW